MRRMMAMASVLLSCSSTEVALAQPAGALAPTPKGIAVVALPGATDAAWPLAATVYANPSLRPPGLDDARARVLCAEPAPPTAPADVRDLAETVLALRGEDAASRALLTDIAHRVSAQALAVVRVDMGHATARIFLTAIGQFDAATYRADESPNFAWSGAAQSLARAFAPVVRTATTTYGPALASRDVREGTSIPTTTRHFYESGWFWGAVGAAVLVGGAGYFAARDSGSSTIHLQMQVPH